MLSEIQNKNKKHERFEDFSTKNEVNYFCFLQEIAEELINYLLFIFTK
jgi:hypothetical protein